MSSVVHESVRLVRKQIFSFFPRETFTCLRCVIKRSALSRRPLPPSSPCALPYACSLPRGTSAQAVLHWPKRESISSAELVARFVFRFWRRLTKNARDDFVVFQNMTEFSHCHPALMPFESLSLFFCMA